METIAQIIGFAGSATAISSFQCKSNRSFFLLQTLAGVIFTIHFILLGAYTGLWLNVMGIIRGFVMYNGLKPWARSRYALAGLEVLMLLGGLLTWEGYISLLPTVAMVVGTYFMWTQNAKNIRLAQLCIVSPCWLTYNIAVMTYSGILTESFNIISVVVSICRFGLKGLEKVRE